MDYRTWWLLLAAVACTLVTAESASLQVDATRLKDPRFDDVLKDIIQNPEKEVRKTVHGTREEKCEILEDGSIKCTYFESTSSSTLTWTPGAIAGLVVGLLVLLACVVVCCVCCCRGMCGRSRA